jgi:hypothetical protein
MLVIIVQLRYLILFCVAPVKIKIYLSEEDDIVALNEDGSL